MKPVANIQRRIADRLLSEGVISAQAHSTALNFASLHGGRVEDILVELELIAEADLLKAIATLYSTRFVSTQKLYTAQIETRILSMVPRKLIDLHNVFPVIFDAEAQVLTVATADPDNLIAFQEVKLATSVRDVRPIVARPAAVRAAIARVYHNDPQQFAALLRAGAGQIDLATSALPAPSNVSNFEVSRSTHHTMGVNPNLARPSPADTRVQTPARESVLPPMPPKGQTGSHAAADPPPRREALPAPPQPSPATSQVSRAVTKERAAPVVGPPPTLSRDYLETVNVLVSLLDNARADLRGHSAATSRLSQKVCDRIGLSADQARAIALGSLIHDLGKAGTYHLTALNVAEYDGHRTAAQKVYSVPENVLSSVALPPETKSAVASMYERFDGKGLPGSLAGKDIPIGARVLAVTDSYADLTQNPRNPARKILPPAEACAVLAKHKGSIFDPTIVDLLTHIVTGDDIRMKLLADRQTILIVDPDPEETTVLELRLIEQGFEVKVARSMQQAMHELTTKEIAGVVSEIDLDVPDDGIALRGKAISEPWGRDVFWVIHTKKSDRQVTQIVFDLGVDDFISKATGADVLVAKLKQILERRKAKPTSAKGVSGSLAEMSLPDMVQILFHGRKSCALRIQSKKGNGEIHFSEGQLVDARFGASRGEDAVYQMLSLKEGDFQIDPNAAAPSQRTINVSPEALLLEGMRRVDEGIV
ncbi:MAG: DUF4388 domain-containing protein [Polyangiaceae bacterium]